MFSVDKFDSLTAQRNRLSEAVRRKGDELQQLLVKASRAQAAVARAYKERERLQREADDLLDKQKRILIREFNALNELNYVDPPEKASSTVFISLDNTQLEEIFKLDPGTLLSFKGPIPIDRPL